MEGNVEILFLYQKLFDIYQIQWHVANKNICADGINIRRLALTISIMRESVLYMYGEYFRPYPAKETVSHKHVTLVSLHK